MIPQLIIFTYHITVMHDGQFELKLLGCIYFNAEKAKCPKLMPKRWIINRTKISFKIVIVPNERKGSTYHVGVSKVSICVVSTETALLLPDFNKVSIYFQLLLVSVRFVKIFEHSLFWSDVMSGECKCNHSPLAKQKYLKSCITCGSQTCSFWTT